MAQGEYFGPKEFFERDDPTDRVVVPVTQNAVLDCAKYCLDNCDLYGEAQMMATVATAMSSETGVVAASWNEGEVPDLSDGGESPVPRIRMSCKGPGKRFILFGGTVCRGVRIDTE